MESFGFSPHAGDEEYDYLETKEKVMSSLKDFFRPEFLNRLDEIIIFDILKKEEIRKIVDLQISELEKRLKGRELKLSVSDKARDFIAESSYDTHYGARPVKRYIQTNVLNELARDLLEFDFSKASLSYENVVEVDLKEDKEKNSKEVQKSLSVDIKKVKKEKIISPIQAENLKENKKK